MEYVCGNASPTPQPACPIPGYPSAAADSSGHSNGFHGYPPTAGSTCNTPSITMSNNQYPVQPLIGSFSHPPPGYPVTPTSYPPNGYPLHGYPATNFPTSGPCHAATGSINHQPAHHPTEYPSYPPTGYPSPTFASNLPNYGSPYPPPGSAAVTYPAIAPPTVAVGGGNQPPVPVTPINRVCVLGEQYMATVNVDLVVNEKSLSLSGGDYTIKDVNGSPIFAVKGRMLSLHKHRTIYNMQGKPIVTMRARMVTVHHRWFVYRGRSEDEDDLLFTVRQSHMIQLSTKLHVFLKGNDMEGACDFRVEGSFFNNSCTIYKGHTNEIIAQMHTKGKITNLLLGSGQFAVTVYPNVDQAFIATLIVLLDEINDAR